HIHALAGPVLPAPCPANDDRDRTLLIVIHRVIPYLCIRNAGNAVLRRMFRPPATGRRGHDGPVPAPGRALSLLAARREGSGAGFGGILGGARLTIHGVASRSRFV